MLGEQFQRSANSKLQVVIADGDVYSRYLIDWWGTSLFTQNSFKLAKHYTMMSCTIQSNIRRSLADRGVLTVSICWIVFVLSLEKYMQFVSRCSTILLIGQSGQYHSLAHLGPITENSKFQDIRLVSSEMRLQRPVIHDGIL